MLDFNKMSKEELLSWIGRDIYYYDSSRNKICSSTIDGFVLEEYGIVNPVSDSCDGFNYCDYANENALYFEFEYECKVAHKQITREAKECFGLLD